MCSKEDPTQPKINKFINFKKRKKCDHFIEKEAQGVKRGLAEDWTSVEMVGVGWRDALRK